MAIRRAIYIGYLLLISIMPKAQTISQEQSVSLIINDIYESLLENDIAVDFESLEADLLSLTDYPINLNSATAADLQRLYFLSNEQIDHILQYIYLHPMHSIYELRLIPGLKPYELRNLLPFVVVQPVKQQTPFYWKEMWHYAKHEVNLRTDARNIEGYTGDPFYGSIKYKFNYDNKIQFGLTMERDPAEPWWGRKTYGFDFYSGYLQLNNIGHFSTIVAGDYRVRFGMGLVVNTSSFINSKVSYLNIGNRPEGLAKYSSTNEADFMRGIGATLRAGIVDLTAFYSAKKVDGKVDNGAFPAIIRTGLHRTGYEQTCKRAVWQQVIGLNATVRYKQLQIGITATENLLGDTLRPMPNYYNTNYFQGTRQFSAGLNYQWAFWRFRLFGEAALSQNTRWGFANLIGLQFTPIDDIGLVLLHRYYSPYFDNLLAHAFGETSRNNDENGIYLGTEIKCLHNWRFACYADAFSFRFPKYNIPMPSVGYDILMQAEYYPADQVSMQWKLRFKQKAGTDKYSLRYLLFYTAGNWNFRTLLEGNIAQATNQKPTFGCILAQDVSYRFHSVPATLQARLQAFHIAHYNNRIYAYENDVLYAFNIPVVYGIGCRYYLNFRYQVAKPLTVYLKAAQTVYAGDWAHGQGLAHNRKTDIHLLLRFRF